MRIITDSSPPEGSLIAPFAAKEAHYVDAFRVRVAQAVTLADFIAAFYTTPLFRAERLLLCVAARRPSTDADVAALASGQASVFAAWQLEARTERDILLGDMSGRTKSWLRAEGHDAGTDLWFGSVIVPVEQRGHLVLGPVFQALMGPHKVYSRLLLKSAAGRVCSSRPDARASRP